MFFRVALLTTLTLLVLHTQPSLTLAQAGFTGFTFEPCTPRTPCAKNLTCVVPTTNSGRQKCQFGDAGCSCYPEQFITCTSTTKCPTGEICASFTATSSWVCMSCRYVRTVALMLIHQDPSVCPEGTLHTPLPSPTPTTYFSPSISPAPPSPEATWDSCLPNEPCPLEHVCASRPLNGSTSLSTPPQQCRTTDEQCMCLPVRPKRCVTTADCVVPLQCASPKTAGADFVNMRLCLSDIIVRGFRNRLYVFEVPPEKSRTPLPARTDNAEGAVCVDAKILRREGVELVWKTDRWAKVLCDERGSCATEGHVVVFKGKAMRMDRYCHKHGCREDWRWVNSPRMRRGLRVQSQTDELAFTPFAARWGTNFEEFILRVAIAAGA